MAAVLFLQYTISSGNWYTAKKYRQKSRMAYACSDGFGQEKGQKP
jgi:hypothetical protein